MHRFAHICSFRTMVVAVGAVVSVCLTDMTFAADVYYSPVEGDAELSWDNADAWMNNNGSAPMKRVPTYDDTITLNGKGIALSGEGVDAPHMLRVTNGVVATALKIALGSLPAGHDASYANSGRVIGLKVEEGGLLSSSYNDFDALSVGDSAAGYGVVTVDGGTISNKLITIGTRGIGVLTNANGRIIMEPTQPSGMANLYVGFASGSTGQVVMTGGSIGHVPTSSGWNDAIITVGVSGRGTFELLGGVVSNRMVVGTSRSNPETAPGAGTGVFKMSGGSLVNRLFLGTKENDTYIGEGSAEITGGTLDGHVYVGIHGRGSLLIDGGTVKIPHWKIYDPLHVSGFGSAGMYVGRYANSQGRLTFKSGKLSFDTTANLVVGHKGMGVADFFSNATVPYLRVGGSAAGGTLTVHHDAMLTLSGTGSVGGYPLSEEGGAIEYFHGVGMLVISNATVMMTGDTSSEGNAPQLYVGRYEDSFGVIRGTGTFQSRQYGENDPAIRMALGNGQIIGDGFGSESILDMHTFASVTNVFTNPVNGTNGWYAVNKGAVLFPRRWQDAKDIYCILGSWNSDTAEPDMVNSVSVKFSQDSQRTTVVRGGFYAADRDDLNLDSLCKSGPIIGVWKIGTTDSVNGTTPRTTFSIANLVFRYDHTKVTPGSMLKLYRWTGSRWTKVASAEARLDNPRIYAVGLSRLESSDVYNIGEFALVEGKSGLTVLVR